MILKNYNTKNVHATIFTQKNCGFLSRSRPSANASASANRQGKKQKTALRDFANALIPDLEHISIVAPVTRDEEICVVYTFRGIRHYWDESGDTALDENDVEGLPFSLQTHQKVLTFIRQQKECEGSTKE